MATVVVLGAGISGHTTASWLQRWIGSKHEVVVVSPSSKYNWIPSNIWVGVGQMKRKQVEFELPPIYKRVGIRFVQGLATVIHPEGNADDDRPFVEVRRTDVEDTEEIVHYDYLINSTGPRLAFDKTPGLGPGKNSVSVCSASHATEASMRFEEAMGRMKAGEEQRFLVGTGHAAATCQGAAFEYIFNLEHELRRAGLRDKAQLTWVSNEYELGDFGMGGMHLKRGGYVTSSKVFTESLFAERGLSFVKRAAVEEVGEGWARYENLAGERHQLDFDFAMLIPAFSGVGLTAVDKAGQDITAKVFKPNGFMIVDADYTPKPFADWKASDWPRTYQSPVYENMWATGIAFAPPHTISKPTKSANGTNITPAPPRTGMPSATIGKAVARTVSDLALGIDRAPMKASMTEMGAACVASAGMSLFNGTAAAMTVFPIVPDFEKYPTYGRDMKRTFGEVGLAGHWIKHALHVAFQYKAKLNPGWTLIPE